MSNLQADILSRSRVIAVVGLSPKSDRDSFRVAQGLQEEGYRIVPVNPAAGVDEILGERVYPDLASIPFPVDLVDVFRRSAEVPPVAEGAIRVGARYLWLQDGVEHAEAAARAQAAGLTVVQND